MSKLKQNTGQDYPDAADKHREDARVLLDHQRFDGAAYLAGYAVECILKTLIQVGTNNKNVLKGHNLES